MDLHGVITVNLVGQIQAEDTDRRNVTQEHMDHKSVLETYISGNPLNCPLNKSLDLVHSDLFGESKIEGVGSGSGSVGRGN
jgi:hypothetical protein